MSRVAVVGASGFIGSATSAALLARGHEVVAVRAPRVAAQARSPDDVRRETDRHREVVEHLAVEIDGSDSVVNAAGIPGAADADVSVLNGAHALFPELVRRACVEASVGRMVQVSSAAVQGRRPRLDESAAQAPFTPYSSSKALGEKVLVAARPPPSVVVYRPASVHGSGRDVTRSLVRLARSPLASVAVPGTRPSPQSLVENVADATAFLATCPERPPQHVLHPWEGVTTAGLLSALGGGRTPRQIPARLAAVLLATAGTATSRVPGLAARVRRMELLWLGQDLADSWLTGQGWIPPIGLEGWKMLAVDRPPGENGAHR